MGPGRLRPASRPGGRADTPQGIYLLKLEEVKETEKIPDAEAKVTPSSSSSGPGPWPRRRPRRPAWPSPRTAAEIAKKYKINAVETPSIGPKDQVPGLGAVPAFNQTALR